MRAGRPTLVVHAAKGAGPGSRVGFVVSKAVGGAVVRNRVKRRLRHLCAAALQDAGATSGPSDVVVRALPGAATAPDRVVTDLTSAWAQVHRRLTPGPTPVSP